MLGDRISRTDTKAVRRKINQKVQTIIKKTAELSENCCEVLLIIHYTSKNHWVQYCTSEPSSLFFGLDNAKKYLQTVEEYNNTTIKKFTSKFAADDNSCSPQPAKHIKTQENFTSLAQTIITAGKLEDFAKASQSALSTDITSHKCFNLKESKLEKPPDIVSFESKTEKNTQKTEENSSPDFSFEDYFGSAG